MYDLTDAAKNAIAAEKPYTAKATIYLADLTEIELTEADLVNTGFAYSAQVLSGEKFVPGSVCASSVTLTLNNIEGKFSQYNFYGAEFVPYIACRPLDGDAIDWLQLPRYTIIDPVVSNSEIVELLGYDNIYKLSAAYDGGLSFPATLKEIVQYCCSKCNLVLNTNSFPLDSFEVQREVDLTDATYQQIMSYVAAIAGCWVSINRQGQVVLDWFSDTPMHTIGKDRMLTVSAQSDDVEITGVRVKAMGTEQDYGETFMVGTEGYVLEFSDNPFIQENTAQTVAQSLASKLNGMTLRPMTVEIIPDISVEVGDCFTADGVKGYLTSFSYTINDRMKLQCKAESAPVAKLKTFSNNVITQIKQNAIVHEQLGAYDLNVQEMNKLAANTMGFYYTQEEQDDGSIIAYWHDKPSLTESTIIYKQGIDGFFLSQDGGKTYTTGRDSQGNAVVNILSAIGIQASWLNIDDVITRINEDGKETIDAGHVSINGQGISSYFASQETVSDIAVKVQQNTEDLADFSDTVTADIDNLQGQIDGNITTWFYDYVPTTSNYPASSWTTTELKNQHLGDLFYIVNSGDDNGQVYRWALVSNSYQWILVEDAEVTKALADAAKAQDTADSKRRVFTSQPKPPYDVGDLWSQGPNGELMRCKTARASGSYVASDWEKASKYTDDTAVDALQETVTKQFSQVNQTISSISSTVGQVQTSVTKAQSTADAAQTAANKAQSAASSAQNAADAAQDDVDSLQTTVTAQFTQINQTTDSISQTVGSIQQVTDAQSESISQLNTSINGVPELIENALDESGLTELKAQVSSIEQEADQIRIELTEVSQYGDTVEQINRFFDFLQAGLKIGLDGSPFYTLLNETELGFYENGNRVAYISNNSLYISSARIQNDLILENPASGDLVRWYVDSAGYVCLQSTSA